MLSILLKFLMPIALFYLTQKVALDFIRQIKNKDGKSSKRNKDQVIEICPECGEVRRAGHRCHP